MRVGCLTGISMAQQLIVVTSGPFSCVGGLTDRHACVFKSDSSAIRTSFYEGIRNGIIRCGEEDRFGNLAAFESAAVEFLNFRMDTVLPWRMENAKCAKVYFINFSVSPSPY